MTTPQGSVTTGPDPRRAPDPARNSRRLPTAALVVVYLFALGTFIGIVTLRGGPSTGDAYGVTNPATALADGDLHGAAKDSVLPQPPGYALLASPFVLAFRPLIGSPTWCDGRVTAVTRLLLPWCAPDQLSTHRWYRSQAVLGLLAWVVFVFGSVSLLRVSGAGGGWAEALLVIVLAAIPAAGDSIIETFHPQDLVSVGLGCAGLAQALRRRWAATGVLFGIAFLCKQFALLPLVAVLVAAPGWPQRARVTLPALAVVGCGILPFVAVDPSGTWSTLSAVDAGVVKLSTGTVVGMANLNESTKLLIARDGPVVLALVMSVWARWRVGNRLLSPVALIGLATACLAGRLVAEVWFASYYLLAVSVGLLVLDLASRRLPVASFLWIAVTGALVEQNGGLPTSHTAAYLAFAASLAAVVMALRAVSAAAAEPTELSATG
ncbi:MAG TPA: hypothetical protein VMU64_12465 [Acidimicrobiales bacterium]|nr:hypothetical protein [Acidimicrobiales bacterium]